MQKLDDPYKDAAAGSYRKMSLKVASQLTMQPVDKSKILRRRAPTRGKKAVDHQEKPTHAAKGKEFGRERAHSSCSRSDASNPTSSLRTSLEDGSWMSEESVVDGLHDPDHPLPSYLKKPGPRHTISMAGFKAKQEALRKLSPFKQQAFERERRRGLPKTSALEPSL